GAMEQHAPRGSTPGDLRGTGGAQEASGMRDRSEPGRRPTGRGREARAATPGSDGTSLDGGPDRVEPLDLPKWLPAVVFAAVTVILFRSFVFTDMVLYGSDTFAMGYMARVFLAQALESGIFPLWNPLLLGGTPFLDSLAGG